MGGMGYAMATHRKMPDFSGGEGEIVNPDFLSATTKSRLRNILVDSGLYDAEKEQFIAACNDHIQAYGPFENPPASAANTIKEIASLASKAHGLLNEMGLLSSEAQELFAVHCSTLALGSNPPVKLEQPIKDELAYKIHQIGGLGVFWQWVQALQQVAEYAASKPQPTRQSKPSQSKATAMVTAIANCYLAITGKYPPATRGGWFEQYVAEIGKAACLSIGPRIINGALKQIKKTR